VGVMGTTLKVSETHRATEIITEGIYSQLRHPQYLGAILAHIGFSILFSGFYALLATPIIIVYNYLIAWKEEKELLKEFGTEYADYMENVPMFIPKLLRLRKKGTDK
jgi:protein-S-isoprenylcysteine O-methyltransferase Ste14